MVSFQQIQLQTFTYYERDILTEEKPFHQIVIFGHLPTGHVAVVRVENYKPHFKLELPAGEFGEELAQWEARNYAKIDAVKAAIMNINSLDKDNHKPVKLVSCYDKRLYFKDNETYPYIEAYFNDEAAMQHAVAYLRKYPIKVGTEKIQLIPRENDIKTYCTYLKFLDTQHLNQSTWKNCTVQSVEELKRAKITKEKYEYIADYRTICEMSEKDAIKMPNILPSVLSFDWECNSQNPLAMPKWFNRKDVAFMAAVTYVTYDYVNDIECLHPIYKRYLLVYGVCAPIDGVILMKFSSECGVLLGFRDLVRELNPTVILGHNILGFDFLYMHKRLGNQQERWGPMGRVIGHNAELIGKDWSSSAYKSIVVKYLDMPGRIVIDTMLVAIRKFKLDYYNLKVVSNTFLENLSKIDLPASEIFRLYALSCNSKLSMYEREAAMQEIGIYAVRDADLPYELFSKLALWFDSIELSNTVYTPISHLYTRGMSCRAMNLIFIMAHQEGFFINDRECEDFDYSGAHVFEPQKGLFGVDVNEYEDMLEEEFYMNPVGTLEKIVKCFPCFDFTSLYPSIILYLNLCYSTLINPKDPRTADIPDSETNIVNCEEKDIMHKVRWAKDQLGLIPKIIQSLLDARYKAKAELKTAQRAGDTTKCVILDGRQLAQKLTANSMYGFFGFKTGKLKLKEGAMSTTHFGKYLIKEVSAFLKAKYNGFIIYGDTDSCMCYIPRIPIDNKPGEYKPITEENYKKEFTNIATAITTHIDKKPISIAYEKAFRKALMIKKKMYAYIPMEEEVNKQMVSTYMLTTPKIETKGIILSRRDNCKFVKYAYEKILRALLDGMMLSYILNMMRELVAELMSGVNIALLTIVKAVGAKYEEETTNNMAIFSQNLIKSGKVINPGDRLEFVYVKVDNSKALQGDRMQTLDLLTSEGNEIDYMYYLEHCVSKPLDRLITSALGSNIKNFITQSEVNPKDITAKRKVYVNTSSHIIREIGPKAFYLSVKDGITIKYIQKIIIPIIKKALKSDTVIDWYQLLQVKKIPLYTSVERAERVERTKRNKELLQKMKHTK